MLEILIGSLITGYIIGYIITKNRPHHNDGLLKQRAKQLKEYQEQIKELKDEIYMLKNPKRLIKEYQGSDGSDTGELLKKMRKTIKGLERKTVTINEENKKLTKEKQKVKDEIKSLKEKLDIDLQNIYDEAIDTLNRQIEKARGGELSTQKDALKKLEEQSKKLRDKFFDKDS